MQELSVIIEDNSIVQVDFNFEKMRTCENIRD